MPRILKPGPRPFIAFAVMCSLLLLLPLGLAITGNGKLTEIAKMTSCIVGLFAMLCLLVSLPRVVVTSDSISYRSAAGFIQRIRFEDISGSFPRILAEPEHPIALEVYAEGCDRPVLNIALKPFRQKDVACLLSLSELKVQGRPRRM